MEKPKKNYKNDRTDPNLPAILEDDLEILMAKAIKLTNKFKNGITETEDIYHELCETYLEGVISYKKKDRTIPIRPFVFNYINFILLRKYRGQYKFENREVYPHEEVLDPEVAIDESDIVEYKEVNPFMFEYSWDLTRALDKYTTQEKAIIYYKFFLNKPMSELKLLIPQDGNNKLTYTKINKLKDILKNDKDLLKLLKEK
jgi:hypothetical protein